MDSLNDPRVAMRELYNISGMHLPKTLSYNEPVYKKRESLLGTLAHSIKTKDPRATSVVPMVVCEDTPACLIARRLAWIVFQEQFPVDMRWAVHRDPFYRDMDIHLLPDSTRTAIQTYRAAAEQRYRAYIRKARRDIRLQKKSRVGQSTDPLVNPFGNHSSSLPSESSSSSQSSSSNPTTRRNFRTMREVVIAEPPSDSRGFVRRRRL